jgi:hypothetical protein
MTFRRAAQYTWKAFLTFLMIGVPGILIQVIASWAMGSWAWAQGGNRPDPAMMGGVAMVSHLAGLWVQFAVIFVVFKYAPSAIAEVLENREAARAEQSSEVATNLEQ